MNPIISLLAAAAVGTAVWTFVPRGSTASHAVVLPPHDLVSRGDYLVKLGGCSDCHTPKLMTSRGPIDDPLHLFAGHPADAVLPPATFDPATPWGASTAGMTAWSGPWGTTYAANLTPDKKTGIGGWSDEEFIQTFRHGRHKGAGRAILPPMPWQALAEATDEDLLAILAYLKSQPEIDNRVPEPLPPVTVSR